MTGRHALPLLLAMSMTVAIGGYAAPLRVPVDSVPAHAGNGGPEGLWQVPGGALFRIEPVAGHQGEYDMVCVIASQADVAPGTVLGRLRLTADGRRADASLMVNTRSGHRRLQPADYAVVFSEGYKTLAFTHYRTGIHIDLFRLLPHIFRPGYENRQHRPGGLDGAVRLPSDLGPIQL